jgi:hypothetical protein
METSLDERAWALRETILSGDIGIEGDDSDNCYHVFYHPADTALDNTAILDRFTITGGKADGSYPHDAGGGMYNDAASPTLTNCTFEGNSAYRGGGMANSYSSPALTNCTFSGNSAVLHGGGMYNEFLPPTLTNSILWGDTPDEIFNYDADGWPVVTYSDIQGGYEGEGNIDAYPWFVDPTNGDFHLGACSPCIDRGDNLAPDLPDFDFEGDVRIWDGDGDGVASVDMGVDEVAIVGTCFRVYLPLTLRERQKSMTAWPTLRQAQGRPEGWLSLRRLVVWRFLVYNDAGISCLFRIMAAAHHLIDYAVRPAGRRDT